MVMAYQLLVADVEGYLVRRRELGAAGDSSVVPSGRKVTEITLATLAVLLEKLFVHGAWVLLNNPEIAGVVSGRMFSGRL